MTTLSIIALIIFSAFAIGAYNHYTADSFAFRICLRDNMKRVVVARNSVKMGKLLNAMRKYAKGSGQRWMLTQQYRDLYQYNVALGNI